MILLPLPICGIFEMAGSQSCEGICAILGKLSCQYIIPFVFVLRERLIFPTAKVLNVPQKNKTELV